MVITKRTALICLYLLLASPAMAQDLPRPSPTEHTAPLMATPFPPSLMDQVTRQNAHDYAVKPIINPSHNQQHITWYSFCRNLAQHIPRRDVEYQDGVDVYGRSVVPADIAQPRLNMPQQYPVLITVNQAQSLGIHVPHLQADSFIGMAYVGVDGSVSFNGQPLQNQTVHQMCGFMAR